MPRFFTATYANACVRRLFALLKPGGKTIGKASAGNNIVPEREWKHLTCPASRANRFWREERSNPALEDYPEAGASPSCLYLLRKARAGILAVTALCLLASAGGQQAAPATDVTFAFTADVHVTFNGYDDHQGILWSGTNIPFPVNFDLILNETALAPQDTNRSTDRCPGMGWAGIKDLCNQIQLVRKLNHLDVSTWSTVALAKAGAIHKFVPHSAGKAIGLPQGLVVGGDLTDCAGGSQDSENWKFQTQSCAVNYLTTFITPECNGPFIFPFGGCGIGGDQLVLFQQLFDPHAEAIFEPLADYPVIAGLKSPDKDVPVKFTLYPGLGNHDFGGTYAGEMMDYVRNWTASQPMSSGRRVTNNHHYSGDYSWDWGRLHILNVGVYAGSGNQSGWETSYDYDQDTMNWIISDLRKYAADGRPVIIVQHFGFDPLSWSTGWYLAQNTAKGAKNIWPALAPYNVIGIFAGHQHAEYLFQFAPGDSYAVDNSQVQSGHIPYDIFQTGAGFEQEFLVSRVTDHFMDVMASDANDWDNSAANPTDSFMETFTKRLVGTPTQGSISNVESDDTVAVSVLQSEQVIVVGANASGGYTLRRVNSSRADPTGTGTFAMQPNFLASYNQGGRSYILVSDGQTLADYRLNLGLNGLDLMWSTSSPLDSMVIVHNNGGNPYLLSTENGSGGENFFLARITPTGLLTEERVGSPSANTGLSQMVSVKQPNTSNLLVIRYVPVGTAEIYSLDIASPTASNALKLLSGERWGSDAFYPDPSESRPNVFLQTVTFSDSTTGILVKSTPCLVYLLGGSQCQEPNGVDSPYVVRTLTQDGQGTQVSWRGAILPITPGTPSAMVSLGVVGGIPQVGMYYNNGLLTRINVNP